MSYLVQYAERRPTAAGRRQRGARVDERPVLNRPKLDGGAHVRVFLGVNEIALEFSVESAELRDNSLYKFGTLLGALRRFHEGLEAEAELYAARERR
jgi:hypothetical protein